MALPSNEDTDEAAEREVVWFSSEEDGKLLCGGINQPSPAVEALCLLFSRTFGGSDSPERIELDDMASKAELTSLNMTGQFLWSNYKHYQMGSLTLKKGIEHTLQSIAWLSAQFFVLFERNRSQPMQ